MIKKIRNYLIPIAAMVLIIYSCKKEANIHVGILNTGNFSDTSGEIKTLLGNGGTLFGLAADYSSMSTNPKYAATVIREANIVTFGNELKYGSIVQNNGSFNYATADAFYNLCTNNGLQVFGHNLVWYQQQNTTYLNGIIGNAGGSGNTNLLSNGSFETWSNASSAASGWSYYNGSSNFSQSSGSANAEDGNYALAATGYGAATGSDWHVQVATTFTAVPGHTYSVTFYAKGSAAGGRVQYEWQAGTGDPVGTQYNAATITTSWAQYAESYSNPMKTTNTSVTLTFDLAANPIGTTVWLDNVVVTDLTAAAANSAPTAIANRVDSVLHLWINSTVSHYAGKIKAWDVLNEPLGDDGNIRTNNNLPSGTTVASSGIFVWSQYLGKDVGVKAFNYAHAADPNALLFINDYNLEVGTPKLDSLIAYVGYLKSQGVHIDGIGTQMHTRIANAYPAGYAAIDNMFKKLAATGLLIRISELDVKVNPASKANFSQVPVPATILASQASMYKYIVSSYLKNVPAAQRYGITVWGVNDNTSWLYNNGQDYPLLFDSTFAKKPSYAGFLQGLQTGQ